MNNKIKKNIVLVVPSLAREGGIILSFIISRYLINKGFDITIVNLNQNCLDMIDDFKSLKAHVINLNIKKGFYRYINLTFSIYRISKRYKPNAILSILFGWHLFIAIGGKLAKVNKVVVHVGNLAPYWERNFWKFKLLVRLAEPFTDKLICCSKFIKKTTIEHFGVSSKHTTLI